MRTSPQIYFETIDSSNESPGCLFEKDGKNDISVAHVDRRNDNDDTFSHKSYNSDHSGIPPNMSFSSPIQSEIMEDPSLLFELSEPFNQNYTNFNGHNPDILDANVSIPEKRHSLNVGEFGTGQWHSITHPSNIAYLPDNVLFHIFYSLCSYPVAYIGLILSAFDESDRIKQIIQTLSEQLPHLYINANLFQCLEGCHTPTDNMVYTWTVCKLILKSGKNSGLSQSLRRLFSSVRGWYHGRLTVRHTQFGWYEIINFCPGKGW